mgnify:CR=1 FL=1
MFVRDIIRFKLQVNEEMDVVYAVKQYITDMIGQCGPGMKVLLMDNDTVRLLSGPTV